MDSTHSDLLMFATLASRGEDRDHIDNAIITKAKASNVLDRILLLQTTFFQTV